MGLAFQRDCPRNVATATATKPMAITTRKTTDQRGSPRRALLTPSRMNAPPMHMYHQPSICVRRCFLSMAEGSCRTT